MRATKRPRATRLNDLANQWCRHGCPEKMTIHVKSTGETIVLRDGLPVVGSPLEAPAPVLQPIVGGDMCSAATFATPLHSRLCESFSRQLPSQASRRYCLKRCRWRAQREKQRQRRSARAGEMLAAAVGAAKRV